MGTLQIWGPCAVAQPARAQGRPWLDGWSSDDRPALGGSCRTLYPGTPVPDLGPARLKGAKPPAIGGKNLTADEGGGFRKDEPADTFIAAVAALHGEEETGMEGEGRRCRPSLPLGDAGADTSFLFLFLFFPHNLSISIFTYF